MLLAVSQHEKSSERLKILALLQWARLQFEKGLFQKAYDTYSSLKQLSVREQGQVQLERAWSKFYLKDYSKALGLLTALRSPYYLPAITPERYILEMLSYKELCHYEMITKIGLEFKRKFKKTMKRIKDRKSLFNDRLLFNMSAARGRLQLTSDLIGQIRTEYKLLKKLDFNKGLKTRLLSKHLKMDKRLRLELDQSIQKEVRVVANELLDYKEQINFLEYVAKIDLLRVVREGENRAYTSEKVKFLTFEKIYWPVVKKFGRQEFWRDEFEDYKMLISSRCESSSDKIKK